MLREGRSPPEGWELRDVNCQSENRPLIDAFNVFYFIFLQIIKQCVIVDYALFQEQYD